MRKKLEVHAQGGGNERVTNELTRRPASLDLWLNCLIVAPLQSDPITRKISLNHPAHSTLSKPFTPTTIFNSRAFDFDQERNRPFLRKLSNFAI